MKTELETQEQTKATDDDKKTRREKKRKFSKPPQKMKKVTVFDSVKIWKVDKEDPTYEDRSL